MKRLLALTLAFASPAMATLSSSELANAGVTPPADARLPEGRFVDQAGHGVELGAAHVPTVLLFADFTCGHLCGPGITLTAGALHDAGLRAGRDYRMVVIGLDQDGPAAARALIDSRLQGLPQEAGAIRLLTGSPARVSSAEKALGYRAIYDPATDQFAHSAATYVFTAGGHLSRVLPETASTPDMLRAAIGQAKAGEVTRSDDALGQLITLCYGFAAAHGVHGQAIVTSLRIAGAATVLLIALALWRFHRRVRAA